jgi:hypothetical protein
LGDWGVGVGVEDKIFNPSRKKKINLLTFEKRNENYFV